MVPKYYFLRMIFEDEALCGEILSQPPLSELQCYQKRRLEIQQKIDAAIEALPELSGPDILEIVRQREEILRRLDRHGSLFLSQRNTPFPQLLQRILRVTPAMIEGYSAALGKILLDTDVTILLDEGKTKLRVDGREYIAKTVLEQQELTLEKCEGITEKLASYDCFPKKISFYLPDRRVFDYSVEEKVLSQREDDGQFSRKIIQLR